MNVVYWLIPLVLGGGLIYLGWRIKPKINLDETPIFLEAAFVRVGLRPPKIVRLWARRATLPPISKAYLEINQALNRTGNKPQANLTPAERAHDLGQALPLTDKHAHNLVKEYEVETFSKQPGNLAIALRAGSEIRKISFQAYIRRLFARLQKPLPGQRKTQGERNSST